MITWTLKLQQKFNGLNADGSRKLFPQFQIIFWIIGRRCEKTCLRGFQQNEFQTSLLSYRD